MSFKNLSKKEPSGRSVWMELPEISPKAALRIEYAGDTNVRYYNAVLEAATVRLQQQKRGRGTVQVTAEMLLQTRDEDRGLFAKFIVKDWRNIEDDEGEAVPYSIPNATDLMNALPGWIFDIIREYAAEPKNFLADDESVPPTQEDAENLAGN